MFTQPRGTAERDRWIEAVLKHLPVLCVCIDADGNCISASAVLLRRWGYTAAQLSHMHLKQLCMADEQSEQELCGLLEELRGGLIPAGSGEPTETLRRPLRLLPAAVEFPSKSEAGHNASDIFVSASRIVVEAAASGGEPLLLHPDGREEDSSIELRLREDARFLLTWEARGETGTLAPAAAAAKESSAHVQQVVRFEAVFSEHPDPMMVLDSGGHCLIANPAFHALLGLANGTADGVPHHFMLPSVQEAEEAERCFRAALRSGVQTMEQHARGSRGHLLPLQTAYIPLRGGDGPGRVLWTSRAVPLQQSLVEHLGESRRWYDMISANTQDLIVFCDSEGILLYVSPAVHQLLDFTPEELCGLPYKGLIHPHDLASILEVCGGRDFDRRTISFRAIHRRGHYVWMEVSVKLLRDAAGRVSNILAAGRDVSARMRAEEALLRSEEKYRRLLEELPEALLLLQEGRWVYVNQMAVRLLGAADRSELLHKPMLQFIQPGREEQTRELLDRIARGESLSKSKGKWLTVQGEALDVELSAYAAVYEDQPAVRFILRDITAEEKAQEMLQNSEKLSLVGQLAAGVAHEIRNPLTAVKGFFQLLRGGKADKTIYYDIITAEISRIEQILGEMLLLARPQAVKYVFRDLRQMMGNVVTLIESQAILNNIEIDTEFDPLLPGIECDENGMKQVFLNLLKNAVEAMPGGGRLLLRAHTISESHIAIHVIDEGCGIPAEKLEKIGQPFYSTKEHGTGLGMMVSCRIIQNHGGLMNIRSEVGRGTAIRIELPVHKAHKDAVPSGPASAPAMLQP